MADTFDETIDDAQPRASQDQDTLSSTMPSPAQTAQFPLVTVEARSTASEHDGEAPSLGDVRSVLHGWLRGRMCALRGTISARKALVACVIALCVAICAVAALSLWSGAQTPPRDVIEAYVRGHLTEPPLTESSGDFTSEEPFGLSSVEVMDARPSTTRRDACDVQVALVYANGAREARVDEQLTYVHTNGTWNCTASTTGKVSYRALTGVDQQQVTEQLDALFAAADSAAENGQTLAALYQGATAEVVDEQFDAEEQTDRLSLRCTTLQGFATYACGLTATFRFVPASGAWELVEATASEGAQDPSFDALKGTWQGAWVAQEGDGTQCPAGQESGLTLVVSEVTGQPSQGMTIAGTVSGVVHAHGPLGQGGNSTGDDQSIEGIAFAGELTRSSSGLVFSCPVSYPDGSGSTKAVLTLAFGLPDDPAAAQAILTTTHTYQSMFLFFGIDHTARFADTYTLSRAE